MLDDIEAGGQGIPPDIDDKVRMLKCWIPGGEDSSEPVSVPAAGPGSEGIPDEGAYEGMGSASSNRYHIRIQLSDSCDSKNLRGMITLSNLEEIGHIESLNPERSIIEDGDFNGVMELEIISDAGREALEIITTGTDVHRVEITEADTVVTPVPPTPEPIAHEKKGELTPPGGKAEKSGQSKEIKNIRVDITRLDRMMNLIEDLVINRGRITQVAEKYRIKELDETLNMVERSVSDLQDLMMKIRMIPLNHTFNRFPRTVRDLAHREGKEVEFIIEGGETELDRSVMDGLNDPLLHLIRNAIDHGIEIPEKRVAAGKPPKGTLLLSAKRDRDNVIITIEDDGGGINADRVKEKAVRAGLITSEAAEALSREEAYELLFCPGFSTAEVITDVSGRGVGLDVVKNSIESLKGTVRVDSTEGTGTKFELLLPPTMAIVNVMMVRINNRRCAIPVNNVVEVASLSEGKIHRIGQQEAIVVRDEVLALDRLDDMFGRSERSEILVIVQNQNRKRSLAVDMIEGQQEVVIKPLSTIVGLCRGVSGVTIPGDGEVVPVLDVNSILKEM
ncbi:MAG: chemotaxis protein CheW, partial [Methanoregulaceae archaeon]